MKYILTLLFLSPAIYAAEYNCVATSDDQHTFSVSITETSQKLCQYDRYNVKLGCTTEGLRSVNATDLLATIEWKIANRKPLVLLCREVTK